MAKIRLTKNELKKQKDELKMYTRYLPTLMLKKQQLQAELRVVEARVAQVEARKLDLEGQIRAWIAVFAESWAFDPSYVAVEALEIERGNIAGVDIPVFKGARFSVPDYDLMASPPWIDRAIERMRELVALDLEREVVLEQARLLRKELLLTSQRVNLFEKVKIPETKQNIKKIRVYLGDQQTAAVVRGKISKAGLSKGAA
jgi:V/A-type H+-transporting ATPase subunit D